MNDLEKKSIQCIKNMPIEETTYQVARNVVLDYINKLEEERDKYKKRCYNALKMIWDNYGVLDKYEIEMLEDKLKGKEDE